MARLRIDATLFVDFDGELLPVKRARHVKNLADALVDAVLRSGQFNHKDVSVTVDLLDVTTVKEKK